MSDALLKHAFQSGFSDGTDASRLQPSDWNAPLLASGGVDGQLLARNSGSATGASWTTGGGGGTPGGLTTQLQFNNAGAFGGSGNLTWDGTTLRDTQLAFFGPDESTLPALLQGYVGGQQVLITTTTPVNAALGIEASSATSFSAVYSASSIAADGQVAIGLEADVYYSGASGAIKAVYAFAQPNNATTDGYGIYSILHAGASGAQNGFAFWAPAPLGTWANVYYAWFDSRGVRRVKEDATFNSVGQAIEALYNPQFTKYTPGATDFERVILGQWNSNEAEIGPEASGAGTLRRLRLIGAGVDVAGSDVTATTFIGALTGNAATATSAGKWTTARNLAGNSVDGSANVAFVNKVILQGTTDAGFSAAQFLGALATGILKNTTTTGVLSIAVGADIPNIAESQVTGLVSDIGTLATAIALRAPLASPTLTGTPTAPTAAGGTNTTQIASTAFVTAALVGVGSGTVTSVGLSLPGLFTLSGTPVTTSGTLTAVLATQTANFVWTGPTSGAAAAPTFRALVGADVPTLNQNTSGSAATLTTPRAINGTNFDGSAAITVTAAAGTLTGSTLAAGVTASSLTSVGTLATLTVTATITGSISGNAATVTTNANLTGVITSVGNATSIGSQTGTGSKFVVDTSPTLVTPVLGVASGTSVALTSVASSTQSIAATSTDGLLVTNTTAASAGAQQWSPRLHFTGQGWKTTATAASQTVDWIQELQPIQGTTTPTSLLVWSSQINGAGYVPVLALDTISNGVRIYNTSGASSALVYDTSARWVFNGQVAINAGNGNITTSGSVIGLGSYTAPDVGLAKDASSTLGVRNITSGTSAMKCRLYNTFTTVATAGEWWKEDWQTTANQFRFGAAMGSSTGTARVASWDYGAKEASPTAAITVPITSGNIVFGGGVQLSNAAVTGLTGGVLAATTNASIVLYDSSGQAYRIPCII